MNITKNFNLQSVLDRIIHDYIFSRYQGHVSNNQNMKEMSPSANLTMVNHLNILKERYGQIREGASVVRRYLRSAWTGVSVPATRVPLALFQTRARSNHRCRSQKDMAPAD